MLPEIFTCNFIGSGVGIIPGVDERWADRILTAKRFKNVILYNFMLINLELLLEASKGIIQTSPKRKVIMVSEHQEILNAIKNKDVAKAKLYLYRHLRNVRDAI